MNYSFNNIKVVACNNRGNTSQTPSGHCNILLALYKSGNKSHSAIKSLRWARARESSRHEDSGVLDNSWSSSPESWRSFFPQFKKDQPQHLQRSSLPRKDGNGSVIVLNRALRFESDKVTEGLRAQSLKRFKYAKQDVWKHTKCEKRQKETVY